MYVIRVRFPTEYKIEQYRISYLSKIIISIVLIN